MQAGLFDIDLSQLPCLGNKKLFQHTDVFGQSSSFVATNKIFIFSSMTVLQFSEQGPLGLEIASRPSCLSSVPDFINTLQNEWAQFPTKTLQNHVENLPRQVEAVKAGRIFKYNNDQVWPNTFVLILSLICLFLLLKTNCVSHHCLWAIFLVFESIFLVLHMCDIQGTYKSREQKNHHHFWLLQLKSR